MNRRERTRRTASLSEEFKLDVRLSLLWGDDGDNYWKITETSDNPGKEKTYMDDLKLEILSGISSSTKSRVLYKVWSNYDTRQKTHGCYIVNFDTPPHEF